MKTQLTKPARGKASYSDQYKQEALELWRASGRSAAKVAVELGIRPPLLYRWARAERVSAAILFVQYCAGRFAAVISFVANRCGRFAAAISLVPNRSGKPFLA